VPSEGEESVLLKMGSKGNLMLSVIKTIIAIYDLITEWIYVLVQKPTKILAEQQKVRAEPCAPIRAGDTQVTYKPLPLDPNSHVRAFEHAQLSTMAEVWSYTVKRFQGRNLLGTRDVLGEDDEVQSNGGVFKKLQLGEYRWMTYLEADEIAENAGRGFRLTGQQPGMSVCLFADTRAEWLITAQACFKQNFPVVTLYTNLGEDAVIHGLNETEVETVITSHELLPKFKKILPHTPSVKKIVFFDSPIKQTTTSGFREDVKMMSFWDLVALGKKSNTNNNNTEEKVDTEPIPPTPDSPCIIMYTSGSTGNPKGVIVTHYNLFKAVNSYLYQLNDIEITEEDTYIGYLPLAHVLELIAESMMLIFGVGIGYSSPNTLTDKSTMIQKGAKGDAAILRPSLMACVPLVLDRIYKGVHENVKKKGDFFEKLFAFCVKYKVAAAEKGLTTPIMDKLIFRGVRALIGGRIRVIFTGGAPLSPEAHTFIKTCMGCPLLQGYGLTETTACATIMQFEENSVGRVGPPVQGINIRLEDWEEGNYRVTDKPWPRGEIIIGGGNITAGYYKMPEKTNEEYYNDPSGRRWFKSGDIGQIEEDGTLRIIDRKKDLVKLQFGEYVSLGKVESVLKTCGLVENICIYGDSSKSYCVALLCPDRVHLARLLHKLGLPEDTAWTDKSLVGAVLRELVSHGKKMKLEKFELPGAVTICTELWTPDTGLVTAAFKLKRKPLQQFYQNDVDRMYGI